MTSTPATPQHATIPGTRRRKFGFLALVIAILALGNYLAHFSTHTVELLAVPVTAVVLLVVARVSGLTWRAIGLSRSEIRAGIPFAVGAIVVVAVIVTVAVAIPFTREFFLTDRYRDTRDALLAAFVLIPIQTVIPEELAFRGVLQGVLGTVFSKWPTLVIGALLFGCWHIATSLGLTTGNEGLGDTLGRGTLGQIAGVLGAVAATAFAGLVLGWLRQRTTSLLAPMALHWALNATGALGAAVAWHIAG